MSITRQLASNNSSKIYNSSSSHYRRDSEELDVFEAARYFSAVNDNPSSNSTKYTQPFIRDDRRMSLDIPIMRPPHNYPPSMDNYPNKPKIPKDQTKKHKQPSSPGGKLASFLNSLFNQTGSKKKKSKSVIGSKNFQEEEESPGGRRRRRSSISHFRITTNTNNADSGNEKSMSNSGFRTPPPYADTPTKSYKAFSNFVHDHTKHKAKNGGNVHQYSKPTSLKNEMKREGDGYDWLQERDDRGKFYDEKIINLNFGYSDRDPRRNLEFDDGVDSDSSSDLFDLPNHELDFYPSGLPVYETTHMDRIKIGASISSTASARA